MRSSRFVLALCLLLPTLPAQAGNGGNGDLEPSPMAINANFDMKITGGAGQLWQLFLSDAAANLVFPGVGTVWIDPASPNFLLLSQGVTNGSGVGTFSLLVPNDPAWLAFVLYSQALVIDPTHPSGIALTRAVRIDFEQPDSFTALPSLAGPRALGTSDLLRDGRILVTGGGAGSLTSPVGASSTEIYEPYTRSWSPGPFMGSVRSFHTSVVLNDGKVMVMGGADSAGIVTSTCEIFDPATNSWAWAASMGTPRAAHAATLLNDGRVLVTGGTSNFTSPAGSTTPLGDVLGPSLATGEVYDPSTNAWTPVSNTMASKRFAHTQTTMSDGRVVCISGLNGTGSLLGIEIPAWTTTVSIYSPTTNSFAAGPAIAQARCAHRATRMANGEIFVAGGFSPVLLFGITTGVTTTNSAVKLTATAGAWSGAGTMPAAALQHGQVLLKNGKCHLSGGGTISLSGTTLALGATAACGTRTGGATSITATTSLPQARGVHLATRLHDGSILIAGGSDGTIAYPSALLYTPAP